MNAYVSRLIARANGELPVASPRLPGQFEPTSNVEAFSVEAPFAPEKDASISLWRVPRVPEPSAPEAPDAPGSRNRR